MVPLLVLGKGALGGVLLLAVGRRAEVGRRPCPVAVHKVALVPVPGDDLGTNRAEVVAGARGLYTFCD